MPSTTSSEIETRRIMMVLALRDFEIPQHMHDGILEYVLRGRSTGSFLTALIDNNVDQAYSIADTLNKLSLPKWAELFNSAAIPRACWGSPEIRQEWQRMGGVAGNADKTPPLGTPALAEAYTTPKPRLSTMISLAADALRRQKDAERALKQIHSDLIQGDVLVPMIAAVLADLAISSKQLEALNAEAMRQVR